MGNFEDSSPPVNNSGDIGLDGGTFDTNNHKSASPGSLDIMQNNTHDGYVSGSRYPIVIDDTSLSSKAKGPNSSRIGENPNYNKNKRILVYMAIPFFLLLALCERRFTRRWAWYRERMARSSPRMRRFVFATSGTLAFLLLGNVFM